MSALFRWPCSICLPGLSLLVPALFRWPCSMSIHLSPRSVTGGVRPWRCSNSIHLPPRSVTAGGCPLPLAHVAFLFICFPGASLLVSALFRWRRNISFHSPNRLPLRRVSQFFLKMCPPFLSLLVSALFRGPCSLSIHLFAMFLIYFCFPLASALFPFPAFLFICPPHNFCNAPNRLLLGVLNAFQECPPCCRTACPLSVPLVSLGLPSCWSLCPFLLVTVSALSPLILSLSLVLSSCLLSCG